MLTFLLYLKHTKFNRKHRNFSGFTRFEQNPTWNNYESSDVECIKLFGMEECEMTFDEFERMDVIKRVVMVNEMLKKEKSDALKNVAEKLQLNYSNFTKMMRSGGFNYNQAKRQYEKVISIEDYKKIKGGLKSENQSEVLSYLASHFEELKRFLSDSTNTLILDKSVYDPNSKSTVKSIKVNNEIYEQFINLCETQFPHLKLKDLITQALLDFTRNYSTETRKTS